MFATSGSVVVVGCGGMGREAAAWAADADLPVAGFVDEDGALHGTQVAGLEVLGGLQVLQRDAERDGPLQAVVAVGDPEARDHLADRLVGRGVPLGVLLHPDAVIGPGVELGPGAIVGPGCVLTRDISIGRAAIVNYGAKVGHDSRLGAACFLGPGVHLAGTVTVGERAEIGIGASIIQGCSVGEGAVVGAGAVVIDDVAPATTVVGVPARPLDDSR